MRSQDIQCKLFKSFPCFNCLFRLPCSSLSVVYYLCIVVSNLRYSSKAMSQALEADSLVTRKFTTRTHCLDCRVQVEFEYLTVNTAPCISYDGYLCKEMLFQLKAMFYKVLHCINNLLSCPLMFLYTGACIMLFFVVITPPC